MHNLKSLDCMPRDQGKQINEYLFPLIQRVKDCPKTVTTVDKSIYMNVYKEIKSIWATAKMSNLLNIVYLLVTRESSHNR